MTPHPTYYFAAVTPVMGFLWMSEPSSSPLGLVFFFLIRPLSLVFIESDHWRGHAQDLGTAVEQHVYAPLGYGVRITVAVVRNPRTSSRIDAQRSGHESIDSALSSRVRR